MSLDWLRARRWTSWLLLACLALGAVVWIHFVGKLGFSGATVVLFGVSLAWSAALAALLAALGSLIELALRRRSTLVETGLPGIILMLEGAGFLIAMAVPLAGRFDRGPLFLAIAGLFLLAFGWWRRRLPYDRPLYPYLHLGLAFLAFNLPHEAGQFFFRWSKESVSERYRWTGSESCMDERPREERGARVRSLKQLKPPYVISGERLRGNLGRSLARRLGGSQSAPKRGVARIELTGALQLGGFACHLPFWRGAAIKGELKLAATYRGDAGAKLRCSAGQALSLDVGAKLFGVAACRDVRATIAARLAREVRKQARELTGH